MGYRLENILTGILIAYFYGMVLHPKYAKQLRQAFAFGLIWMAFGLLYVFLEYGLLGGVTEYPSTGNRYDFTNALVFIGIGSFFAGMTQGWIEISWLGKRFSGHPFWKKILFKSIFYLSFIILILVVLSIISNAQLYGRNIFDPVILNSITEFIQNFAFWSVVLYSAVVLDISLFYAEMRHYLGGGVLYNYSLGKYHRPRQETRIFMFLDMKSSTSIAERIGHRKYFDLLKAYYADMTDAILETSGEIYQYVGDEIVVTWPEKFGIYKNNCIQCLALISEVFEQKQDSYLQRFGLVPEFKAGYHIGEVTIGEIGIIKKDIIYTGDVLNTTARIQAECNTYGAKALISGKLLEELQKEDPITFTQIGTLTLRGKTEAIQLYSVVF